MAKINKIEINRAFKTSNKAKLINTEYNYTAVDNGVSVIGTYYPYSDKSLNSSNLFLYDVNSGQYPIPLLGEGEPMTDSYSGTLRVPPSNITERGNIKGTSITTEGQDFTILGKEILYGIPYSSYEYDSATSTIVEQNSLMLVHTMQSLTPYYYDFDHIGVQWELNFDNSVDYSQVSDIVYYPKKHIWLADRFPGSGSGLPTNKTNLAFPQYLICSPYEYNRDINGYYLYADPIHKPTFVTYSIPFYSDMPSHLSNYDFNGALIYSCRSETYTSNVNFQNHLLIHNVKTNYVNNNVNYHYTDAETQLVYYANGSSNSVLRFNFKLLPTTGASSPYGDYPYNFNGAPITMNTTNYPRGYDCSEFIFAYEDFKNSGSTICPASRRHGNVYLGETFLPTIPVSSTSEMIYDSGYYYAPIDEEKCDAIFKILENICSTAVSEVLLIPTSECPNYSTRPKDLYFTKNDTIINRTETEQSPVDFFAEE